MIDIVERLRLYARHFEDLHAPQNVTIGMREAADEIERLRAGLFDCIQEAANHHRENQARAKIGGSDMAQRKAKAIVSRSGVLLYKIKYIARAALEGK